MKTRKEVLRFLLAGALAGSTDLGVYFLLRRFLSFSVAKGISFTLAFIVAYWLNKYWIFPYRQRSSYSEVGRYVLVNILALEINILINKGTLHLYPGAFLLAFIIASTVTGLLTFSSFKWWVFKARLDLPIVPRPIL
ncbi:MAG: GtrA family protein [Candidatus Omnitrophota bacterium]